MSGHTALAIAAALVASLVFALIAGRWLHALSHPRVSESDEECAAHCHAELDGAGLPAGLVCDFHTTHVESFK